MSRSSVRLFVGLHLATVVLVYAAALWVGGYVVGDPFPVSPPQQAAMHTKAEPSGSAAGVATEAAAPRTDLALQSAPELDAPWVRR